MNESTVTAAQLADDLGCSIEKVYRMARHAEIPSIRVGRHWRFYPSDVKARLSTPSVSWAQSRRSTGRKRAA